MMKKILIFIFFCIVIAIFFSGYLSRFNFFLETFLIRNKYHRNGYYSRSLNEKKNNRDGDDRRRDYSEYDSYDNDYNDDHDIKKNRFKNQKKPNSNGENYLKKHDDDDSDKNKNDNVNDDRSLKEKGSLSLDMIRYILEFFISIIVFIFKSIISIIVSPFLPLIMFVLIFIIIFFIFKGYCSFFSSFDCQYLNDLISNIFSCCLKKGNKINKKEEPKNNNKKKIENQNDKQIKKFFKKMSSVHGIDLQLSNIDNNVYHGNHNFLLDNDKNDISNNYLLSDGK